MTSTNVEFESVDYHEAGVLSFASKGNSIHLKLKGPELDDNQRLLILIHFEGVSALSINGVSANSVAMDQESGEVVTLQRDGAEIFLVVEWANFRDHTISSKAYRFAFNSVKVSVSEHRN